MHTSAKFKDRAHMSITSLTDIDRFILIHVHVQNAILRNRTLFSQPGELKQLRSNQNYNLRENVDLLERADEALKKVETAIYVCLRFFAPNKLSTHSPGKYYYKHSHGYVNFIELTTLSSIRPSM